LRKINFGGGSQRFATARDTENCARQRTPHDGNSLEKTEAEGTDRAKTGMRGGRHVEPRKAKRGVWGGKAKKGLAVQGERGGSDEDLVDRRCAV